MALNRNAATCLSTFLLGSSSVLLRCFSYFVLGYHNFSFIFWLCVSCFVSGVLSLAIFLKYKNEKDFQVAVRAGGLGVAFGLGYHLSAIESLTYFGYYFMALSFFHFSEYFTTAVTNPSSLSLASFLLDHSREYTIAAIASWVEYFIEICIYPGMKRLHVISLAGLLLVIFGEVVRKGSMFTATTNFNHYVQYVKKAGHELVTHGVYSWCRHPSYVGWFYWSIGTQLVLCNPLCLIAYTVVSWKFFNERIQEEEIYLLNFFGEDYVDYKKRVGTGLPFIKGYQGQFA